MLDSQLSESYIAPVKTTRFGEKSFLILCSFFPKGNDLFAGVSLMNEGFFIYRCNMKQIPLRGKYGKGTYALVDDEDFDELNKHNWHCDKNGYAKHQSSRLHPPRKMIWMHRVINKTPENILTDHADGNTRNNQKYNLRDANQNQNMQNGKTPKNNTSGYKGVYLFGRKNKKWRSSNIY